MLFQNDFSKVVITSDLCKRLIFHKCRIEVKLNKLFKQTGSESFPINFRQEGNTKLELIAFEFCGNIPGVQLQWEPKKFQNIIAAIYRSSLCFKLSAILFSSTSNSILNSEKKKKMIKEYKLYRVLVFENWDEAN